MNQCGLRASTIKLIVNAKEKANSTYHFPFNAENIAMGVGTQHTSFSGTWPTVIIM